MDDKGKIVTQKVNVMNFKNFKNVDGGLIAEISTSVKGDKIKLEDRQKALDKLSEYFEVMPDSKWKRRIEEEKLKLARRKLGDDEPEEIVDDGFLDALNAEAGKVWEDETED
jgi:phage terminase small subunit